MPFSQLLDIFKTLPSWMDETAAAAYVRGCTAAQRGGTEAGEDATRTVESLNRFRAEEVPDPEQQTARRLHL